MLFSLLLIKLTNAKLVNHPSVIKALTEQSTCPVAILPLNTPCSINSTKFIAQTDARLKILLTNTIKDSCLIKPIQELT